MDESGKLVDGWSDEQKKIFTGNRFRPVTKRTNLLRSSLLKFEMASQKNLTRLSWKFRSSSYSTLKEKFKQTLNSSFDMFQTTHLTFSNLRHLFSERRIFWAQILTKLKYKICAWKELTRGLSLSLRFVYQTPQGEFASLVRNNRFAHCMWHTFGCHSFAYCVKCRRSAHNSTWFHFRIWARNLVYQFFLLCLKV